MPPEPVPKSLQVLGLKPERENSDIAGRYFLLPGKNAYDRPVYQQRGQSRAVIRYWGPLARWIISRDGSPESDSCVAWAQDISGCLHPGRADLLWNIWDSQSQDHIVDRKVLALDAPSSFSFVGRSSERVSSEVNGEYRLIGVSQGRPCYQQAFGTVLMRYCAQEQQWILSYEAEGNVAVAFAEATSELVCSEHLEWRFYDAALKSFVLDPESRTTAAPSRLCVLGREFQESNIFGSFKLVAVKDGRPVYSQPNSQTVIRYSAKNDWWLIDCEGAAPPSILTRVSQWLSSGNSSAASDRCSAYAKALGTTHPGSACLEWLVWNPQTGRHDFDPHMRATTGPRRVWVQGRSGENSDIVGEYLLAGTHCGWPFYQKLGDSHVIRYYPPGKSWLIDREGLQSCDMCVAHCEALDEHPAFPGARWHVFETGRGCFMADEMLGVVSIEEFRQLSAAEEQPRKRRRVAELGSMGA